MADLITFTPPIGPSPGTSHKPTVSLWKADFGDGYSQPTPKGINHIKTTTSLRWDALTLHQMEEINDFFERMGGHTPFYYRPFGICDTLKWTCEDWLPATNEGIWSFNATLLQSWTNRT